MIIFRYLMREVLVSTGAVCLVLFIIIMTGRLNKYLENAASGLLEVSVLLKIMFFRSPDALVLILPLSLFLSFLLVYGRLYAEHEATILHAAGIGDKQILSYSLVTATVISLLIASLALYFGPYGVGKMREILTDQENITEFDTLIPGKFQSIRDGSRVTYAKALSLDKTELFGIFMLEHSNKERNQKNILVAQHGYQQLLDNGDRYLVLENGFRYAGVVGGYNYQVIDFEKYGILMPKPNIATGYGNKTDGISTRTLYDRRKEKIMRIELYWRFSLPILAFIITLIAVPIAKINPRQDRYITLIPGILLYMSYLGLLIVVRGMMEKGKLPILSFWVVHVVFFIVGLCLVFREDFGLFLLKKRVNRMNIA